MAGVVKMAAASALVTAALWTAAVWAAGTGAPAAPTQTAATSAATLPAAAALELTTVARPEVTRLPAAPNDPKTLADLQAIQARVEAVVKVAVPATVSIQFENEQGSGVIVSKDGYVLTAGHVSGTPGKSMRIVLADGRRVHGKALGANNGIDSGMIKITETGDYPFVPVGSARKLSAGQWVVALGHPGGYVRDRPPVVRLGRVLIANTHFIGTDSPLISGDSGGPVFDLDGRLIAINSRIGETTTANIHVPIDTFTDTWARLAKGDEWGGALDYFDQGGRGGVASGPVLGVHAMFDEKGAKVSVVRAGTPAEKGGLKEGDIITMFNGQPVKSPEDLAEAVSSKRPGDAVTLAVLREAKSMELSVRLGSSRRFGGGG